MIELCNEMHRPAVMSMEVACGDEGEAGDERPEGGLLFGPYAVSPLRGLHFDAESDPVTS
jgi:hypothetical protein